MDTVTQCCSCGRHFDLRVELVLHSQLTGHQPLRLDDVVRFEAKTVAVSRPLPQDVVVSPRQAEAPRRAFPRVSARVARPLIALGLVASILAFNFLMEDAVRACTAFQTTFVSQVVCP